MYVSMMGMSGRDGARVCMCVDSSTVMSSGDDATGTGATAHR